MWLVKNKLRATISFRGLDLSIPAGGEFDLDALGRDAAEGSNQVAVAFEEGYLENIFKAPRQGAAVSGPGGASSQAPTGGFTREEFDARMTEFQQQLVAELKAHIPQLPLDQRANLDLEQVRAAISEDVKAIVDEVKLLRDRFESMKGRVKHDPTLSESEVKARLAYLEEKERELMHNFKDVGRRVEAEDGDVMDKADLLGSL